MSKEPERRVISHKKTSQRSQDNDETLKRFKELQDKLKESGKQK